MVRGCDASAGLDTTVGRRFPRERGISLASPMPEVPTMDRYDESKHVHPMSPEDEIRSVDRDITVTRESGMPGDSRVIDRSRGADMSHDMSRDVDISRDRDMSRDADMSREHDRDDDAPKREGDILGLGGAVIPKDSDDPSTEYD